LFFLWFAFALATVVAGFAIFSTGRTASPVQLQRRCAALELAHGLYVYSAKQAPPRNKLRHADTIALII
jgi:hypothetical protein